MAQELELTDVEEQVFAAVTAAETSQGRAPYAQEVARESGLDEQQVREALSALATRHDLVAEIHGVPDQGEDLGAQYTAKQRP